MSKEGLLMALLRVINHSYYCPVLMKAIKVILIMQE